VHLPATPSCPRTSFIRRFRRVGGAGKQPVPRLDSVRRLVRSAVDPELHVDQLTQPELDAELCGLGLQCCPRRSCAMPAESEEPE